jgi:hypothetical protein
VRHVRRGILLARRYQTERAGASRCCATLRGPHPQPPPSFFVAGAKAGFRVSENDRSPGPTRVPRLFQCGPYGAECCWHVGTRPNQPGLRPAPLRCAVLIPSHLLRSSWLGLRSVSRQRKRPQPRPDARTKAPFSAARTARTAVGTSVPDRTSRGFGPLRCARGPHPQPPPSVPVAGAKVGFASAKTAAAPASSAYQGSFQCGCRARSTVGTSVPVRTSRGFRPLRCASRPSSPATSFVPRGGG